MISGSIIIQDDIITSMDIVGNLTDFQKLLLLRDIVLNSVDNYEKEYQKKLALEANNYPKYEEK